MKKKGLSESAKPFYQLCPPPAVAVFTIVASSQSTQHKSSMAGSRRSPERSDGSLLDAVMELVTLLALRRPWIFDRVVVTTHQPH